MRITRRGRQALAVATVAGLLWPTAVAIQPAAAASSPTGLVAASPAPGDRFASPRTAISFRNITPAALGTVRVVGSHSGVHAGSVVGDPAGATIWKPRVSFVPGERVTVDTAAAIAGAAEGDFSFTVARVDPDAPEILSPASGTGPNGTVDASAPTSSLVAATCKPLVLSYRSEPSLTPPGACVNQTASGTAPGYVFVAPRDDSRGNGAAFYDNRGDLVWYDPVNAPFVHNLEPVMYGGKRLLAFYQSNSPGNGFSRGEYVLMDEHYQVVSYIRAGDGYQADLHELTMTPQGTALIGCYVPVRMDLTGSGGTANQVVYDYVVQEVDVASGNVLFSWHALDHVPVTDSYIPVPATGSPLDYFHGNSIALSSDGNLLIGGRNVSAAYLVDRSTGAVIWQLGGKHTSFTLPTGQQWFCYQHDARQPAANVVTVFDDGGSGPTTCPNHPSRALTLTLDTTNHTAAITRDLHHNPDLSAGFLGSNQTLPNGDALASWGQLQEITEFSAANQSIFDMSFSGPTYRAFRTPWTGSPYYPPAVAARKGSGSAVTVYASWNGATQVAYWQVLAGSKPSSMTAVGSRVRKITFETAITVNTTAPLVAVQARDASGKVLATSPTVPTNYTPSPRGYYVGTTAGNVYNFGAPFYGSLVASGQKPAAPLVGTVVPPTRSGYYLPSSAGNVYNYGSPFYGSLAASGKKPPAPVVGLAAYRGTGYYLATSRGNVYNFNVSWFGSMANKTLPAPVVGVAVDQSTGGYWLVTSKGNVYNFNAPWFGSLAATTLPASVVGIAAEPDGAGYLLVTSKGNVYNFGRARWYGSPAAAVVHLASPVVGIGTQQPTGAQPQPTGYYVVCANGDVYNYGIALPGSPNGLPLPAAIDGVGAR